MLVVEKNRAMTIYDNSAIIHKFDTILKEKKKMRAIPYLNPTLLKHVNSLSRIKLSLKDKLLEMPNHWDHHLKLESAKMALRSTVLEIDSTKRRMVKDNLAFVKTEIEQNLKTLNELDRTEDDKIRLN